MRFRERQGIAYLLVAFAIFWRSTLGQGGLASRG